MQQCHHVHNYSHAHAESKSTQANVSIGNCCKSGVTSILAENV